MERSIYVVTHGEKLNKPDPKMTRRGHDQVKALRPLLPETITQVICGTGKRHVGVAVALGLTPTRYTAVVGGPESGESSTGGKVVDVVRLAGGSTVPYGIYTTLLDSEIAARDLVGQLGDGAVICAGRPSMIMFGVEESASKSAAVYRLVVNGRRIVRAEEVHALGEAEVNPA